MKQIGDNGAMCVCVCVCVTVCVFECKMSISLKALTTILSIKCKW